MVWLRKRQIQHDFYKQAAIVFKLTKLCYIHAGVLPTKFVTDFAVDKFGCRLQVSAASRFDNFD